MHCLISKLCKFECGLSTQQLPCYRPLPCFLAGGSVSQRAGHRSREAVVAGRHYFCFMFCSLDQRKDANKWETIHKSWASSYHTDKTETVSYTHLTLPTRRTV